MDAHYLSSSQLTASNPVPTLDDIDRQLGIWEAQAARVKANLDLLLETPSYAFISAGLKLTGRTEQQIVAPIMAARELVDQYDVFAGQVARARLLRDSLRRFLPSNKDTLRAIDRLLNQPCIPLPAAQVALAKRNLLDDPAAASQLSLGQLLDAISPAFAAARDAVTRYDQVMAELTPVLKAADAQLADLAARAAALDAPALAEVERVRAKLAETRREALEIRSARKSTSNSHWESHSGRWNGGWPHWSRSDLRYATISHERKHVSRARRAAVGRIPHR